MSINSSDGGLNIFSSPGIFSTSCECHPCSQRDLSRDRNLFSYQNDLQSAELNSQVVVMEPCVELIKQQLHHLVSLLREDDTLKEKGILEISLASLNEMFCSETAIKHHLSDLPSHHFSENFLNPSDEELVDLLYQSLYNTLNNSEIYCWSHKGSRDFWLLRFCYTLLEEHVMKTVGRMKASPLSIDFKMPVVPQLKREEFPTIDTAPSQSENLRKPIPEMPTRKLTFQLGKGIEAAVKWAGGTLKKIMNKEGELEVTHNKLTDAEIATEVKEITSMVHGLRAEVNGAAVKALFEELENDAKVSLAVFDAYRFNWDHEEGSMIGEAIKQGRQILTEQKHKEIVAKARELSLYHDINDELNKVKLELRQDFKEGKVILQSNFIAQRYAQFFELSSKKFTELTVQEKKSLSDSFNKMVNDVWLNEELKQAKLHTNNHLHRKVEQNLLLALGLEKNNTERDVDLMQRQHQAELKVLEKILYGEGLENFSIEQLKKHAEDQKREARIMALGVQKSEVPLITLLIKKVEEEYQQILDLSEPQKNIFSTLPEDFPEVAKRYFLKMKKNFVNSVNSNQLLPQLAKKWANFYLTERPGKEAISSRSLITNLKEKITTGSIYADREKKLENKIGFYKAWGDRIVREMIQGIDDEQEIFGQGVCLGLSLRWAVNDMRLPTIPATDFVDLSKVGKVSFRDRLRQLKHELSVAFGRLGKNNDNITYPKQLLDTLGVEEIIDNNIVHIKAHDKGATSAQVRSAIVDNLAVLKQLGTFMVNIYFKDSVHAIYLRIECDDRGVFKFGRIGDPNLGVIEIQESEKKFLDCLSQWFATAYPDIKSFECERIILKKKL